MVLNSSMMVASFGNIISRFLISQASNWTPNISTFSEFSGDDESGNEFGGEKIIREPLSDTRSIQQSLLPLRLF